MKITFTEDGMSTDGGTIDPRFVMATERGQHAGVFIGCKPENVDALIERIEPMLKNQFGNNYWTKHKCLVWEGGHYNVAYCDGVAIKGCDFQNRDEKPTSKDFPVSPSKIVRLTLKAFDGNAYHGQPFLSLEDIDVPEDVITYKDDNGWVNDWEN